MVEPSTKTRGRRGSLPPTRRAAALSVVLSLALFVLVARLAERHLAWRADLSDDHLSRWSDTAISVFDRLDDVLSVELFFSGDLEHSSSQLYRRALVDRFQELDARTGDRVRIVHSDPSTSSQDRFRALRAGIKPRSLEETVGTSQVEQDVYFGAVLRYRGDEVVLPFLVPSTLEYDVASAVHRLTEDARPRIGWYVGVDLDEQGERVPASGQFLTVRRHLERRYEVVDVGGIESGVRVPEDFAALVVVAPRDLAPRGAFEIESYVRHGGSLLVLDDRSRARMSARRQEAYDTGLEDVLAAWGAPVSPDQCWDVDFALGLGTEETNARGTSVTRRVSYPLFVLSRGDGLDQEFPVTARFPAVSLRWAHVIEDAPQVAGVTRRDVVHSSERAFTIPVLPDLRLDSASVDGLTKELLARNPPRRFALVAALDGRFPRSFEGTTSPPALDFATREPVAGSERAVDPSPSVPARVVVVGDADWARETKDLPLVRPDGELSDQGLIATAFADNLADWLTGSDDLVALRANVPRDRSLVDFDAEALAEEGVSEAQSIAGMTAAAERAHRTAQHRRTTWTLASMGASLVLVGALVAVSLLRRRAAVLVDVDRGGAA
ncbi:MAG: GldG family protein [Planctomycetota bacterium]